MPSWPAVYASTGAGMVVCRGRGRQRADKRARQTWARACSLQPLKHQANDLHTQT